MGGRMKPKSLIGLLRNTQTFEDMLSPRRLRAPWHEPALPAALVGTQQRDSAMDQALQNGFSNAGPSTFPTRNSRSPSTTRPPRGGRAPREHHCSSRSLRIRQGCRSANADSVVCSGGKRYLGFRRDHVQIRVLPPAVSGAMEGGGTRNHGDREEFMKMRRPSLPGFVCRLQTMGPPEPGTSPKSSCFVRRPTCSPACLRWPGSRNRDLKRSLHRLARVARPSFNILISRESENARGAVWACSMSRRGSGCP